MNEIKQYKENEPKLEDFGLDVSVYGKSEEKKSEEEELIDEKIGHLEVQKKKIEKTISLGNAIDDWQECVGILLFPLSVFLAGSIYGDFEPSFFEGILVILWCLIVFVVLVKICFYFFRGVKKLWIGCKKSNDYDYERKKIEKRIIAIEKLQKRKEEISLQRLQDQKQNIHAFENSLREYWERKMKRSHSLGILDSVEAINENLLTTKIDTSSYKKALEENTHNDELKETLDSLEGEKRVSEEEEKDISGEDSSSSNESDFVRTVRNAQRENESPLAPEKKFRTPRKIDWEELNAKRKKTGLAGEEIVMNIEKKYLRSINRDDLARQVEHRSKDQGDGLGYDILSFFEDGREKYIEVKSTT
ncbi:MAG: DUF3883 domain-containing protein, partial [Candidatus Moranbacteria bacterium]|nr:DUF3883 domain-containing protein [Candidatus Moranbacteria bacterium]